MRWLGSRSYGIYLWHYPVLFLIAAATGNNQVAMIAGLAVSLVIAEASWRWLEQPVLRGQLMRKKSKYASTPPPTASSASARPTFATLNGTV